MGCVDCGGDGEGRAILRRARARSRDIIYPYILMSLTISSSSRIQVGLLRAIFHLIYIKLVPSRSQYVLITYTQTAPHFLRHSTDKPPLLIGLREIPGK